MASAVESVQSGPERIKLPPGPGFFASFEFVRNPYRFLDDCARRYGDWFTMRVPGVAPFVFTSAPDAIREIFQGDPEVFHAGKANRPLGAYMGERSLLFLDGAAHLHDRRLILPALHGERMKSYATIMRSAADDAIAKWPINQPFALLPWARTITFNVIMRTVFGIEHGPDAARLRDLLQRLFTLYASRVGVLFAVPWMRIELGGLAPWGRAVRLHREVTAMLFQEFERRRDLNLEEREDVLSMLLLARDEAGQPLDDEALRDEMLTLLLAGHETTAASIVWVALRMLENLDVMARACEELSNVVGSGSIEAQHVNSLRYLDATINETARLSPVIPNAGRELQAPAHIGGRDLPAGVVLAPCIYLANRRPDNWPEPERFNPDRFLDSRQSPYVFFPFGGGTRRCVGAAFATYQMKIVLAQILSRTELTLVQNYVAKVDRKSIAFAPSGGLPVIVTRRD